MVNYLNMLGDTCIVVSEAWQHEGSSPDLSPWNCNKPNPYNPTDNTPTCTQACLRGLCIRASEGGWIPQNLVGRRKGGECCGMRSTATCRTRGREDVYLKPPAVLPQCHRASPPPPTISERPPPPPWEPARSPKGICSNQNWNAHCSLSQRQGQRYRSKAVETWGLALPEG